MADGDCYKVSFEIQADGDVWFHFASITELPSDPADWRPDDLMRALRNEAVVILDDSLRIEPQAR